MKQVSPPGMKKVSSPTPHTLTPLHPSFKLAVHERWYTTKHENLTPTTPLHPYTPTPFFKLEGRREEGFN
jgi:hypothetical protein